MRLSLSLCILFSLGVGVLQAVAQQAQSALSCVISFRDSLQPSGSSPFVYNAIRMQGDCKRGTWTISVPSGWRLVGTAEQLVEEADSIVVVPISLLRQPGATAAYAPVRLHWVSRDSLSLLDTFFWVRAAAIDEFSIYSPAQRIELAATQQSVVLPLTVQNRGTTAGTYQAVVKSAASLNQSASKFRLLPGRDTTLRFMVRLPERGQGLQKLTLQVDDQTGSCRTLPVAVARVFTQQKVHPTPFASLPITLETGVMQVDRELFYVGNVSTEYSWANGKLALQYRTRVYGMANTIERNVATLHLSTRQWDASVGQLAENRQFFSYGRGVHVLHRFSHGRQAGIQFILHRPGTVFTSNQYRLYWQYQQKKFNFVQQLVSSQDKKAGLNGYILSQEASFMPDQKTTVKASIGLGFDHFLRIRTISNRDPGWGWTYYFLRKGDRWEWQSAWQYFQKSYPGIDKGLRSHLHQITRQGKRYFSGLFYQYQFATSSLLQDTLYYADVSTFNTEKTGIRAGARYPRSEVVGSVGSFRQTAVSSTQLPRYAYGEFSFSWLSTKQVRFSLRSLLGYANNGTVDKVVLLMNHSFNLQFKRGGVRAFYVQQPLLRDSVVKVWLRYNRTLLISPYFQWKMFRRLNLNVRYSLAQTRYDKKINASLGVNAQYNSLRGDWQLQLAGNFPFGRSAAPGNPGYSFPFLHLTLRKTFQVPLWFKRRYHDLSISAFEDLNGNLRLDTGERLLPHVPVKVNQDLYSTAGSGTAKLINADTGQYNILLADAGAVKGVVPVMADTLSVDLKRSTHLYLAFRKSRMITGKVSLFFDERTLLRFSPDNILVSAVDSAGRSYSTLTNAAGEYFFNLPAGRYTVMLNQEAFAGSIRPEQVAQPADLLQQEKVIVNFVVREQKRKIRYVQQ